ncbi:hypothetical protein GW17_00062443, partial [Ensete ventricosum]
GGPPVNHRTGTYRTYRAVQGSTENLSLDQGYRYADCPLSGGSVKNRPYRSVRLPVRRLPAIGRFN